MLAALLVATLSIGKAVGASAAVNAITNREQLAAIASDLAGTYVLESDIDLLDIDWVPLGNDKEPFTGTYQPADGSHPPVMFFTWCLSVTPSAD